MTARREEPLELSVGAQFHQASIAVHQSGHRNEEYQESCLLDVVDPVDTGVVQDGHPDKGVNTGGDSLRDERKLQHVHRNNMGQRVQQQNNLQSKEESGKDDGSGGLKWRKRFFYESKSPLSEIRAIQQKTERRKARK